MNQDATARRRAALLSRLEEKGFIATNLEHSDPSTLRYLTGFTGEGTLLLCEAETLLLTDSRYTEQAERESEGVRILECRGWASKAIAAEMARIRHGRWAFASRRASYRWVEELAKLGPFELIPQPDPVSDLRAVKDAEEVEHLRTAARLAEAALQELLEEIRPGMDEAQIALRLEWLMRESGSEGVAFAINVSAGENTALNHYNPVLGRRPLQRGDLVLFDFGACVGGYRSDITRTVSVGPAPKRLREIYEIVLGANRAAIAAVRSGLAGSAVDAVARKRIVDAGFGDAFGHGLGHGIGLEVHERPSLSMESTDTLVEGMVVTIEPGIYLRGVGGVRIEDDVVVTHEGCDVLTAFPKDELREVGS